MFNVLYIAPVNCSDGWGEAARRWLRALHTTGFNITVKAVNTTKQQLLVKDPLVIDLENNFYSKYDAVIQNTLPNYFDYNSKFGLNIGLTAFETSGWINGWQKRINMMDDIWLPSEACVSMMLGSNVNKNAKIIPEPCNPDAYRKSYESKPGNINSNNVIFYWIGEYIERKNLINTLKAFHLEFAPCENVDFLIKTNCSGMPPNLLTRKVDADLLQMRNELALYDDSRLYKQEYVITERLTDDEMFGLHQFCDVFTMCSRGEAWSLPMFDAWAFGNELVNNPTGCYNEIRMCNVPSYEDSVNLKIEERPYKDLFTPRETWLNSSILNIRKAMRESYNNVMKNNKAKTERKSLSEFSYESVGERMKKCLS